MTERADDDDTPKEQQLLMTAWESLIGYVTTCDDDDRPVALVALQYVANLISGAGDDEDAAQTWTCLYCPGRKFGTEDGLAKHLESVHADREKQTAIKPERQE